MSGHTERLGHVEANVTIPQQIDDDDDDEAGVYIVQINDDDADPRQFWLIGPFPDWQTAGEWGVEHAPNIYWQVVDVIGDPRRPVHIVAPSDPAARTELGAPAEYDAADSGPA